MKVIQYMLLQIYPDVYAYTVICCCSVAQSCLTLRDPIDCSTPGSTVPYHLPEFAQVHVHCISDAFQPSHPLLSSILYTMLCYAKSLQSCPTLCDPIDSSLPVSSIHGIFQARVLEWGAIAFSDTLYKMPLFTTYIYQAPL